MKCREPAEPGSIPYALGMFGAEVRFYREIAPVIGVRVPRCYAAEDGPEGTRLVLEDLSSWRLGADPVAMAGVLADMHERWTGLALERWPWLRQPGAASELVGQHYDRTWAHASTRADLPPDVRELGDRLRGRVPEIERLAGTAGPRTLVHGDASERNVRTSVDGEIALLDWEDVGAAPGVTDLAGLLLSAVPVERWDDVIEAYGPAEGLLDALPAAASQALLSFADTTPDSYEATGGLDRLSEAARRLS